MWSSLHLSDARFGLNPASSEHNDFRACFDGVLYDRIGDLGTYGRGFEQQRSLSQLCEQDIKGGQHYQDKRDYNQQYQSLVESPVFTPQEMFDAELNLANLQKDFLLENLHTVQVLVQEAYWPIHYKTMKPISNTTTGTHYCHENVFYTVAVDNKNLFGGCKDKFKSIGKILKNKLKGAEYFSKAVGNDVSTPMMAVVDFWGQRFVVASFVPLKQSSRHSFRWSSPTDDDFSIRIREIIRSKLPSIKNSMIETSGTLKFCSGEDDRTYIFSSYNVLPPIAPNFLVYNQKHFGFLVPTKITVPVKSILAPYIECSNPHPLIDIATQYLGKPHLNGGFLILEDKTLVFYRGGATVNRRACKHCNREVRGPALLLPGYFSWNPCINRFHAAILCQRERAQSCISPESFTQLRSRVAFAESNRLLLQFTCNVIEEVVPLVNNDLRKRFRTYCNDTLKLKPFRISDSFHKYGVNLRFLGFSRSRLEDNNLKAELLSEMISRVFKYRVRDQMRKARCFHDEHVYEDKSRYLGLKEKYSGDWFDIVNGYISPLIQRICVQQFNLLLGHANSETGISSKDYMCSEIKVKLLKSYPESLNAKEIDLACNLWDHVLSTPLQAKTFQRAQICTGVYFSDKISGKNPLKDEYVEKIVSVHRFLRPCISFVRSAEEKETLIRRLSSDLIRLETCLPATHENVVTTTLLLCKVMTTCFKTLPQANKLLSNLTKSMLLHAGSKSSKYALVVIEYGKFLQRSGDYGLAIDSFARGMYALEETSGEHLIDCSIGLCLTLLDTGKLGQVKELVSLCQGISDEVFGVGNYRTVDALYCTSKFKLATNDLLGARRAVQAAVVVLVSSRRTHHPKYAEALRICSEIDLKCGMFVQAKIRINKCINIWRARLDEHHPFLVEGRIFRAKILLCMAATKTVKTELMLLEKIVADHFGPCHPLMAYILVEKANFFFREGNVKEALVISQDAKLLCRRRHCESHGISVRASHLYGLCQASLANFESAHAIYSTCIHTIQSHTGCEHPEYCAVIISMAELCYLRGLLEEATKLNKMVLISLRQSGFSNNHPLALQAQLNLMEIETQSTRKCTQALELICSKLKRRLNIHPRVAIGHLSLARVKGFIGDDFEAQYNAEKALSIALKLYGNSSNHIFVAVCRIFVAKHLIRASFYDYAKQTLAEAKRTVLLFCEEQVGNMNHPLCALLLKTFSTLAVYVSDYPNALRILRKSLAISQSIYCHKYVISFEDHFLHFFF